ncbi:MAG: HipA domain-containing protein [Clostridia bacterium]
MKLEQLEAYRENGYINMDKLLHEHEELEKSMLKESRGSQNREKDWIKLEDTQILLRTENMRELGVLNTSFAELLTEEIAKQVGLDAAHYDLITYKGKKGVLSQNVIDSQNESLINMSSILAQLEGYDNTQDMMDFISFEDVILGIKNLNNYEENITKEDMYRMQIDFCKIVAFDIFSMNTDRNGQNFSILYSKDSSRIAPIYDNEHSFGGGIDEDTLKRINANKAVAKEESEMLIPVIEASEETTESIVQSWKEYCPREEEKNIKPYNWQSLIFVLGEDLGNDEITDFFETCYNKIDVDGAFENVEKKIKFSVPEEYKECVKRIYDERKKYIADALILEEEKEKDENSDLLEI